MLLGFSGSNADKLQRLRFVLLVLSSGLKYVNFFKDNVQFDQKFYVVKKNRNGRVSRVHKNSYLSKSKFLSDI